MAVMSSENRRIGTERRRSLFASVVTLVLLVAAAGATPVPGWPQVKLLADEGLKQDFFGRSQDLLVDSGVKVTLSDGAQARNVFFQVAGQATLSVGSEVQGNILGHTAIVLNTGASLTGRALSQIAVTLDANDVVKAS